MLNIRFALLCLIKKFSQFQMNIYEAWLNVSLQFNCLGLDWALAQPSLFLFLALFLHLFLAWLSGTLCSIYLCYNKAHISYKQNFQQKTSIRNSFQCTEFFVAASCKLVVSIIITTIAKLHSQLPNPTQLQLVRVGVDLV